MTPEKNCSAFSNVTRSAALLNRTPASEVAMGGEGGAEQRRQGEERREITETVAG
jgi:hypothetical protein